MFNNDASYARSRLNSSYMKGKEKGFYKIVDIYSKTNDLDKATIIAFDEDRNEVKLHIKDLDFSIGKLGYVNDAYSGTAMFISRLPIRRDFRQGLRSSQLSHVRNGSYNNLSENWLESNAKSVNKCLRNRYQSFNTVIELAEECNGDIAFSKNFALSSKYKLLYKGFTVGDLTKNDKFKLYTAFNFIEEEFTKEVGNDKLSR
jgi:hypothetical protein